MQQHTPPGVQRATVGCAEVASGVFAAYLSRLHIHQESIHQRLKISQFVCNSTPGGGVYVCGVPIPYSILWKPLLPLHWIVGVMGVTRCFVPRTRSVLFVRYKRCMLAAQSLLIAVYWMFFHCRSNTFSKFVYSLLMHYSFIAYSLLINFLYCVFNA